MIRSYKTRYDFRDLLSPTSKSRYGWNIAKATYILNATDQVTKLLLEIGLLSKFALLKSNIFLKTCLKHNLFDNDYILHNLVDLKISVPKNDLFYEVFLDDSY